MSGPAEGSDAGLGRRRLLGYAGAAAAGAAVGAGGVAGGLAGTADGPRSPGGVPESATGSTISPYGDRQPGVATPTPAVVELVALDLRPELHRARDREALGRLMRVWTGDLTALSAGRGAPGDTTPWLASAASDLTITVGLGPRLLGREWGIPAPDGFEPVPPMRHDRLQRRWTGGDLALLVQGRDGTTVGHAVRRLVADAAPFATQRWRQQGSWNGRGPDGRSVTGRNLFGQVDGTANPDVGTALHDQTVWIGEGPWAGGTTLVLRRIRMDLDTWDELTRDEQERSVGRGLDEGAPLTGGVETDDLDLTARSEGRLVVARDAHARRSHPSANGGARIFRKGANWVDADTGESGLLFLSFQADLTGQFTRIQRRLDASDALNEWTTAIGSAEFAVLPGLVEGGWLGESLLT